MTLLTPLGALIALAALLPLGAFWFGERRVGAARRELGLEAPPARSWLGRRQLTCATGAVLLLALAAAQPALNHTESARARTHVAALFVIDTSRSMAASATPTSVTRLGRAIAAAAQLRSAIPEVPAGVATLTDRVLPSLMPVPDQGGFDGVLHRSIAIESPPPSSTSVVATSFGALREIASGNYFPPSVSRRVVVLLTDGESGPFDAASVARALPAARGYRFIGVRFWNGDEAIYDSGGRAEPGYHPNPNGQALMAGLASAARGRSFSEGQLGAASSYLRTLVGTGPSVDTGEIVQSQQTLAPFVAIVAVLLLLAALVPPLGRTR